MEYQEMEANFKSAATDYFFNCGATTEQMENILLGYLFGQYKNTWPSVFSELSERSDIIKFKKRIEDFINNIDKVWRN
jgi:hypothetical protein